MKRGNSLLSTIVILWVLMTGCIEYEKDLFTDRVVEMDAAVWNNFALNEKYPLLTRTPGFGRQVFSTDPIINRASGAVSLRVNLLSAQLSQDEVLAVSVVTGKSTAVAGTHFVLPSTVTIPANSSFGFLDIQILDPGPTSGSVTLVIQLDGNDQLTANVNYNQVGISIAQN